MAYHGSKVEAVEIEYSFSYGAYTKVYTVMMYSRKFTLDSSSLMRVQHHDLLVRGAMGVFLPPRNVCIIALYGGGSITQMN